MRQLGSPERSGDGRFVILRDDAGEEFVVALDDQLRRAVSGQAPGTAERRSSRPTEKPMDIALRPRDIQARIRAGESPESVADVAQVPLERIMGYAVPVMAEREHICERARRAPVRRRHSDGPSRLLGEAIDEQLRGSDQDPAAAVWDSWRRDDGRWTVTVAAGARQAATYLFDVPGRFVTAQDDAARALIGDQPPMPDPTDMAIASAVAEHEVFRPAARLQRRRLGPVEEAEPESVPSSEPEAGPESGPESGVGAARVAEASPVMDAGPSPVRPLRVASNGVEQLRLDDEATSAGAESPETPPVSPGTVAAMTGAGGVEGDVVGSDVLDDMADTTHLTPVSDGADAREEQVDASAAEADDVDALVRATDETPAPARRRREPRRTSVPSWDEIMFGKSDQS